MNLYAEFPLDPSVHYLNHAAIGVWPQRTARVVKQFADENVRFGATHYPEWSKRVSSLRHRLAEFINAESVDDIGLLKNTSEALSVVAWGLDWNPGDNVVLAEREFPSNRLPWQALSRLGVECRCVNFDNGEDSEAALMARTDGRTRVLTTSAVHYDNGWRMDLQRLGAFCRQREILFCVDAIQSLGALPFDAQACHADFVMADAHKWLLGPEGIALFYSTAQARKKLQLHQQGWCMVDDPFYFEREDWTPSATARRFEPGSLNTLGIFAFEASLSLLQETGMEAVSARILDNVLYLSDRLSEIRSIELLSPTEPQRRSGILTFRSRKQSLEALHHHLQNNGVVCAQRGGGIRLSPHFYTSRQTLDGALNAIEK